jgi:oligopeptide transport system substrate-binding protein
VYTWTRAALPATRGQAAGTNLIDIEGVDAVMRGDATEISGISIPDDRTLVIRLREPNVVFLYKMADSWGWGWIKQDVFERDPQAYFSGQNGLPLANGAFQIDRWIPDDRLIFTRNATFASWFGEPANLETVHLLFNRDASTLLLSYENNELDMVSIDPQDLDRYNAPGLPHNRELRLAPQGPIVMGFRESLAPMEDPLIRQAFYQAIDRDLIGKQVYRGTWVGATSMHVPDFPFFNPQLQLPKYDPAAAKDALARSTYRTARNLPPIQMSLVAGDQRGAVAMQQMWKDVLGVDVQIKTAEFPYEAAAARRHITFGGRGYSWPDVGCLPYAIWETEGVWSRGATGLRQPDGRLAGYYRNPALDQCLRLADTTTDARARWEVYYEVERLAIADTFNLPLWHRNAHCLVKPWVMDHLPNFGFSDLYGAHPSNIWIAAHD